ncbi:MAG: hypothetical protein K0Q66_2401, partial [Chitinophagaceae bacterium]|nr:hypothetical protein [Chitinophagaceae bacterium]
MERYLVLARVCLILLLSLVMCQYLYSQPVPRFTTTLGSPLGADEGNAVATDGAGNVYVAGQFEGKAIISGVTLISDGRTDMFFAKYNSTGVLQWIKRAGGPGKDYPRSISIFNNEIYITGNFGYTANFNTPSQAGSNELTATTVENSNFFIAKYGDDGSIKWLRSAGPEDRSSTSGNRIAVNYTGVYIVGQFGDTLTFSTPATPANTIMPRGQWDAFLAKYDHNGNFV